MVVGVVLLQFVTGNQLVRLVLGSVGAVKPEGQPQASDRLKGGRLLGPMERLLILGLGLAGQLAAATAVVAAKSIIRFPEINAQKARENGSIGIDDVTEYFLRRQLRQLDHRARRPRAGVSSVRESDPLRAAFLHSRTRS